MSMGGWECSRVANYNVKRYLKEQWSKRRNGQSLLQFDAQPTNQPTQSRSRGRERDLGL